MTRNDRVLRAIERRWIAAFGEPPALLTDPELMLAVLEEETVRLQQPAAAPPSGRSPRD